MDFNKKMRKRLAVTTAGLVLAFGVSVQAAEPREVGACQKATPVTAVQETMQTTSAEAVDFGMEQAETEQSTISMDHLTDPLHAEETVQFHAREIEEESIRARQEQITQERAAAEQQKVTLTPEEQALLASIIFCEAGNQPYEGQVAVGAVILNRVKSGSYPNSVAEVIYQPGQFGPAMTGWLDTVLASGSYTPTAMQAAVDAAAGSNPIGDCLYFGNGDYGILIGDHYFH